MILLVDQNEKATNPAVVSLLKKRFAKVLIRNLKCGDVNIPLDDGGILAIERKEPTDLLRSIRTGELWEQLEGMANHSQYFAVIVTGFFGLEDGKISIDGKSTDWEGKPFQWDSSSIDNLFTVIQWSGCALKFCSSEFYPDEIERLYQVANKPQERGRLKQRRIVTFPPLDERLQILAQYPGIGLKRSESLLSSDLVKGGMSEDEYGSLAKAFEVASTMSLIDKDIRPEGWGPKTILNLRKMLGLASNEYLKVAVENGDNQDLMTEKGNNQDGN